MKSFKQFNEAKDKEVFFTFGRFNPPTTGHQKLMDKIAKVAKGKEYKIYASNSVDPKKNPLSYKDKIRFMRKMFPKHARSIMMSPNIKTAINIAVELHDMGYNKITMVVGGDRIKEFESLLKKYNGVTARHGFYEFTSISVVSAGERDPDAADVTGMSASKMRAAVADGDFKSFQNGLPKGYSGGADLFNALRKAMGYKKITDFREHVQLDKVSDVREQYARGEIFKVGDRVFNKENKIVTISERKPNYIVSAIGKKYWIQDLSEVKQDPDVKDKKGTQPAKYYGKDAKGKEMSKSTKDKRDAHFKKGAKMDDDDPDAYKPAPGDKSAKTKPSKHTKKFKQMFGEKVEYFNMVQLKKQLKKEYGSKASSLKIVNVKGGVSIQTPSGNELERYNHVPKLGYTAESVEHQLDEKLITFAKQAYPKSGHALILAGGAGSGKGFVLDNLIGLEGKKFDVDELKKLTLRAPKIKEKIKAETGVDMDKFTLTKSADVGKLHDIVADELNLPNKKMAAFFVNIMNQRPEDKPNAIFDVTLKDLRKLDNITRLLQGARYPKKNIHIVWVVNDVEVAKKQNLDPKRGRVVPVEILVNTHRGASQTMLDIVKMGSNLKKYMDGDIVFAFNKVGIDGDLAKSDKGGSYLKDANYFYIKRSGKPTMKHKDIEQNVLSKIQKYVPAGQSWSVKESMSFKDTYGEFGTDDLTKKYKKATPGEDIDEGEKKKSETWEKGFERRVVRTTSPEHKEKGYEWRIKGKERPEVTIKLYKKKPDFAEFKKQMKRVAGHEFGG